MSGVVGLEADVSSSLQVRVLGPFEVLVHGRPAGPAGVKRRGLLAMLALSANRAVPVAELIDGVWGEAAPVTAVNVVQSYVSAWRKVLRFDQPDVAGGRLTTTGNGYRLVLAAEELDLAQLEGARRDARDCAARSDYLGAARVLGEVVLRSEFVPPLGDLRELPFHAVAAARLEDVQLGAIEEWAAAQLEGGTPRDVVSIVRAARDRYPLRERLTEMLMWALWQEDRQDEALGAYEELRRRLAEELGIDPAEGVRQMHARLLRQDRRLAPHSSAVGTGRRSLPRLTDTFVGRTQEVPRVKKLVEQNRLVTLIGPGGAGKTRLAIEVAQRMTTSGMDVAFVDCAPLVDAEHIPDRLAAALQVRPLPSEPMLEALARAAGESSLLILLDNLEQLRTAASVVVGLLSAVQPVRVLATSRGPLHARGEQLFTVPPLAIEHDASEDTSPAVKLFVDRARAIDPDFSATPERLETVRRICQRLDGLPLAIELAASRLRLLSLDALAERLHRALDLLDTDPGDRPVRHRALRATVHASYDLLSEDERRTFRALAAFRGGWDPDAARAVSGVESDFDALLKMEALLDAGLIERAGASVQPRFRMLETLREFATEQLHSEGEHRAVCDRHARHYLAVAEAAGRKLSGPDRRTWLDRLEDDRDNLFSAFSWLIGTGRAVSAAPAACSLWRFWHSRGLLEQGRQVLDALREATAEKKDDVLQADILTALGHLTYWQRNWSVAASLYAEALSHYQAAQSPAGVAESHYNLGFTAVFQDTLQQARENFNHARAAYERVSRPEGLANADAGLALVDRMTGAYEQAQDRAVQSLAVQQRLGNEVDADNTRGLLASIHARNGNLDDAEAIARQVATAHYEAGNIIGVVWMLHELAAIAARRGFDERAVRLSSAARTLEIDAGGGIDAERLGLTGSVKEAISRLSADDAARATQQGAAFTAAEAIANAMEDK